MAGGFALVLGNVSTGRWPMAHFVGLVHGFAFKVLLACELPDALG